MRSTHRALWREQSTPLDRGIAGEASGRGMCCGLGAGGEIDGDDAGRQRDGQAEAALDAGEDLVLLEQRAAAIPRDVDALRGGVDVEGREVDVEVKVASEGRASGDLRRGCDPHAENWTLCPVHRLPRSNCLDALRAI